MLTNEEASTLRTARSFASRSVAKRLKVGAALQIDKSKDLIGWNSIHQKIDNAIGELDYTGPTTIDCEDENNVTRPEVMHAEVMLICYAAAEGYSLKGKTLCVTHSPCIECAKLIAGCGIAKLIYIEDYRSPDGIVYLHDLGVTVVKAPGWSFE